MCSAMDSTYIRYSTNDTATMSQRLSRIIGRRVSFAPGFTQQQQPTTIDDTNTPAPSRADRPDVLHRRREVVFRDLGDQEEIVEHDDEQDDENDGAVNALAVVEVHVADESIGITPRHAHEVAFLLLFASQWVGREGIWPCREHAFIVARRGRSFGLQEASARSVQLARLAIDLVSRRRAVQDEPHDADADLRCFGVMRCLGVIISDLHLAQ